jgi:hypothetical protein
MTVSATSGASEREGLARRHLRLGFGGLALFVLVGLALETILGLRAPWYVDDAHATRRLMLTLGHAHGALLSLVHVAFALTTASPVCRVMPSRATSRALVVALVLVPLGFLGGGSVIHDGDPGLPIVLVPIGGVALFAGLLGTLRALRG